MDINNPELQLLHGGSRKPRIRLAVSVTSKGVPSWEVTVDGAESDSDADELLEELTRLVQIMEAEYQPIARDELGGNHVG